MAIGEAKTAEGKVVKGEFVTLRDIAKNLKINPQRILRWVKNKKINVKGYKNQLGHWVFREEDVSKIKDYLTFVEPQE